MVTSPMSMLGVCIDKGQREGTQGARRRCWSSVRMTLDQRGRGGLEEVYDKHNNKLIYM
mgnify:CR=1 FL=1